MTLGPASGPDGHRDAHGHIILIIHSRMIGGATELMTVNMDALAAHETLNSQKVRDGLKAWDAPIVITVIPARISRPQERSAPPKP